MPEHRGQQHHRERIAEALRDEIAAVVQGELADPRIGLVTVADLQLSPNGREAHVFFTSAGSDEEAQRSLDGLNAARSYMRRQLALRLQLRHIPDLHFSVQSTGQHGTRVDELLKRIKKRER